MTLICPPAVSRAAAEERLTESGADCLYREFTPLVQRLMRQFGDTAELREELKAEIYYRFRTIVDAYDPQRGIPFRPYVVRMLTSPVYTFARNGWIRRKRESSLDAMQESLQRLPSYDPTPRWNDNMHTEQILRVIPDEIARLADRQRHVLIWRYYDGRSFEWIAEQLDVKAATARSLLRHALKNLRIRLEAQQDVDAYEIISKSQVRNAGGQRSPGRVRRVRSVVRR
jgi:RNA polymerase sigma factor (sigma-70 family)